MYTFNYTIIKIIKRTCQYHHVYAPNETPKPSHQHETNGEYLSHSHTDVNGNGGHGSTVFC